MTPEEVLSQITDGIWVNKGGLRVPTEVVQALSNKEDWFDSIQPVVYSQDNLPSLKAIINYFSKSELDDEVGYASAEILQSCYGVNKVFNSKVHGNPSAVGQQKLDAIGQRPANIETYKASVEVNNILINWKHINSSGYDNDDSVYDRIKSVEQVNKDWFSQQIEDLKTLMLNAYDSLLSQFDEQEDPVPQEVRNHFVAIREKTEQEFPSAIPTERFAIADFPQDNLKIVNIFQGLLDKVKEELADALQKIKELVLGKDESKTARAEARQEHKDKSGLLKFLKSKIVNPAINGIKKLCRKVGKLLSNKEENNYKEDTIKSQFGNISSAYGAIVPVDIPTTINAIEVLKKITESILTTFILKGVQLPGVFVEALKNTTISIILKRLDIPGGEAIRYITGGLLRTVKDLLPAVFNNTGMFAGAWGLLTACAPYILAAAILVIIAIKMAKRNQLGDFILILGLLASQTEPDICCTRVIGDEKMEDIQTLKEGFITETNKNYDFIYALTFKNEELARSLDISQETPVIIPEAAAITIKEGLSSLEYMDF
ncbi:hypothetical protein BMF77_pc00056 (plasmid) [Dolichospermum sp. UHCC 0315A]|uniref:hypothetical protein n=1 Tax=Dolichospermum sp. UHCC 0315A TaxID=1914871 RepID=UPI0011E73DBF|nr:hypothetical protein [Dolichospermum sp. UHCC 0315A]QEI41482.1 hypothetical protein BMF77_02073 [Dolichospermum sp. UHCC 0315A]QEI44215.1 hypothetical protein BMF77_04846 [Dolichospermum sp. UHCC 0315A]QEI44487.1 hypothetical protein BMF77_pc00056 [Dolichospermum sp. UHCC 0315A]